MSDLVLFAQTRNRSVQSPFRGNRHPPFFERRMMRFFLLFVPLFLLASVPSVADDIAPDFACLQEYNGWNDVETIMNRDAQGFCFHAKSGDLPKQPGLHVFDLGTETGTLSVECEIEDLKNIEPRPGLCVHVIAGDGWGGVRGNHILMLKSCRIERTHPCDE
ncbi:MAG: hypothetical protein AAFY24_20665 [Pseudomonadota bacterium]